MYINREGGAPITDTTGRRWVVEPTRTAETLTYERTYVFPASPVVIVIKSNTRFVINTEHAICTRGGELTKAGGQFSRRVQFVQNGYVRLVLSYVGVGR